LPHVVLSGNVEIQEVFHRLQPLSIRDREILIRTIKKYLDTEKTSIIVESLAGTLNNLYPFFTLLNSREDGLVIRIHPSSKVEKTPQVKQLLAELAKQLLITFQNLTVGKTNLEEYLDS